MVIIGIIIMQTFHYLSLVKFMVWLLLCLHAKSLDIVIPAGLPKLPTTICALDRQYTVGIFEEELTWYQAITACQVEGYKSLDRAGPRWRRRILMKEYLETLDNFTSGTYWTDLFRPDEQLQTWYSYKDKQCATYISENMTQDSDEQCAFVQVNVSSLLPDMIQLFPASCYSKHSYACIKSSTSMEFTTFKEFDIGVLPDTIYVEEELSITLDDCQTNCANNINCTSYTYNYVNSSCKYYIPLPYYNEADVTLERQDNNVTFAKKVGCEVVRFADSDLNQTIIDGTFTFEFPNCSKTSTTSTMYMATSLNFINASQQLNGSSSLSQSTTVSVDVNVSTTESAITPDSATSGGTVDSITSSSSGTPTSETCACNYCNVVNISEEELAEIIRNLINNLRVDTNKTSAYRRAKTSAEDHRPEAKAIGVLGILFTIVMLCIPILLDLSSMQQSYKSYQKTGKVKPREEPKL